MKFRPSVCGKKSLAREGGQTGHVITLSDHIVRLKIYTIFEGEPVVPLRNKGKLEGSEDQPKDSDDQPGESDGQPGGYDDQRV